jgi:DNA-binding transcriptional LysR family regulator
MLRIAAPNDYGASTIAPIAASFIRKYPACRVELLLADTKMDLLANQIDLSIRVGWLDDSSHQARRIGSFRQLLVASPSFSATLSLNSPEDAAGQPFIANLALKEPVVWRFIQGDFDRRTVRMQQNLMSNSTPAVLAATLAGAGISVLPDFLAEEHIDAGRLTRLLPDWSLPAGGIYVVYPAARFRTPKVTAFVAMLTGGRSRD